MSTIDQSTYAASGALVGGYGKAKAIVPDDNTDLTQFTSKLWIGTVGDVSVHMAADDQLVQFLAVPAGTMLDIRVSRLLATGTSATGIVALYI